MSVYKARDILAMDLNEIAAIDSSQITIEFEDGVSVKTTIRKTVYSRFFWAIHEYYDKLPIYSRHFVESVLVKDNGVLNSNTHINLLKVIAKDTIELYRLHDPVTKEPLLNLIYTITNTLYNELNKYIDGSVVTIDILDFLNLAFDKQVMEANSSLKPTPKNIERIHKKILGIINNSDPNNNIVKAVKAKMVNANQVTQCLSLRGYLSEVDGKILSTPVESNFTLGLNKLHDFVVESRSAAKSLYFSEAPLEDAEYFARRLQLLTMYVKHLDHVDCGSTEYVDWQIRGPEFTDANELIYPGDLNFMKGKWYLDQVTNSLKSLEGNEKHLEGTTIKLRSPLTCRHPDKHTVCAVCFGRLSDNISKYANLGHICSATMTRQTSQSVLSNKHYQGSSITTDLSLGEQLIKYFTVSRNKSALILNAKLAKMQPKLVVTKDNAMGLIDVLSDDNVDDINPVFISSIDKVGLTLTINGNNITEELLMLQSNRRCMLSKELIVYIKEHQWILDSNGNFIFDLANWDYEQELLVYPKKEYSFSDHSKQVAKIIETGVNNVMRRSSPESIVYTLKELFDMVNSKLNVNISLLEVIVYAITVPRDGENCDLSRNYRERCLGVSAKVIKGRSLSNLYAFQNQAKVIVSPEAFDGQHRPDSVYDIFMKPKEVLS